jgi:hypothetical protein
MYRRLRRCLLPLATILLAAADPAWKQKPLSQWNAEDAKQLLADSPWVKHVTPHWLPDLSPFQREDGGDLNEGVGKGVGLAGTGILGSRKEAKAALPVRVAEQKAGETDVPVLKSDDYAIAVYGIPAPKRWNLAGELKDIASLRRYKKKDMKPSRVEILRHDDDTATIVYLFPRSVEITKKDGGMEFAAQIGRLWVSQYFYTGEMQLRGEPQILMPAEGLH